MKHLLGNFLLVFLVFQGGSSHAGVISPMRPSLDSALFNVQRPGPLGNKTTEMMIESGLSKWANEWDGVDKDLFYARATMSLERMIEVYPYIPKEKLEAFRAKVPEFEKTRCRQGTKGCY